MHSDFQRQNLTEGGVFIMYEVVLMALSKNSAENRHMCSIPPNIRNQSKMPFQVASSTATVHCSLDKRKQQKKPAKQGFLAKDSWHVCVYHTGGQCVCESVHLFAFNKFILDFLGQLCCSIQEILYGKKQT